MFDALQDTPRDFQFKLMDALNSLGQTMEIPPTECFDKVLCASDDENPDVKKKMYNWWRAFFEILGKVVGNMPKVRSAEFTEKMDALMAEIMKSGDKTSGENDSNEVVLEDYEEAPKADEDDMLKDFDFAVQHIGEIANKVKDIVNFVNPYCESVGGKEDIMNENEVDALDAKGLIKLVWESQDDEMEMYGQSVKGDDLVEFDVFIKNDGQLDEDATLEDIVGVAVVKFDEILSDSGWSFDVVPANEDNIVEMWNGADFDGKVDVYNDQTRLGDSDGATFQITCIKANGQFNEVDNTMKKTTNERRDSDWVSMNDIVGMEVGESDEEPINWDDEDTYNDGGFERGMWVIWTDPDGGEESVWKILKMPESEDDLFVLGQKDGSINEVYGWEIRPRDADPAEYNESGLENELQKGDDGWREIGQPVSEANDALPAEEFLDKVLEDAEDTDDVFDVYDGNVVEDGTVALNVTVYKEDVEDGEVEAEFKDMPTKYGWEYECFAYSNDLPGAEGTETIVVYFRPMKRTLSESWHPACGVGEVVSWKDENDEMQDGWKVIGHDVNTFEYHLEKDGKDVWVDDTRVEEYNESKQVNEASVVVDANDVWDVLDLLDDETANKHLTDLINSHVRSEEEIMDAIDSYVERYWSGKITKQGLVEIFTKYMYEIVDSLGLDVEKYKETGEFVDSEKPVTLEGSDDEKKPDEVKGAEKKYKQDGETKTLVTGEDKHVVTEMTIEQEITDPWRLLDLLWGQGKDNLQQLLDSNLFSDDRVMDTLEQFEIKNLTNLNDLLAYDFESVLEAFGCDVEAWTQHLEIQKA